MISVITPTYARAALLPAAYQCFAAQTVAEREWIVIDDSPEPSAFMQSLTDTRVRYVHLGERSTSGEKRNMAVAMADGDVIVLFDDDDYYAPAYIEHMLSVMQETSADFVKLGAFFVYSKQYKKFGYCDLQQRGGFYFRWSPNQPMTGMNISPDYPDFKHFHLGYGFSYVFKKHLWGVNKFPAVSFKSDAPFVVSALEHGAKLELITDDRGLCLHILHEYNVSASLVQFVLPEVLVAKWLPHFSAAVAGA